MVVFICFLNIIILALNICELIRLFNIDKRQNMTNDIVKKEGLKREHARLAKTVFASPLNPYDIYKDKNSNLYTARKQKGGIEIKEDN